jgi:hypothetical protein
VAGHAVNLNSQSTTEVFDERGFSRASRAVEQKVLAGVGQNPCRRQPHQLFLENKVAVDFWRHAARLSDRNRNVPTTAELSVKRFGHAFLLA